jgi:hypothetical protein
MTKDEIRLVTFVVAALLVGAATKHYRKQHPEPVIVTPPPRVQTVYPSSRRW